MLVFHFSEIQHNTWFQTTHDITLIFWESYQVHSTKLVKLHFFVWKNVQILLSDFARDIYILKDIQLKKLEQSSLGSWQHLNLNCVCWPWWRLSLISEPLNLFPFLTMLWNQLFNQILTVSSLFSLNCEPGIKYIPVIGSSELSLSRLVAVQFVALAPDRDRG